MAAQPTSSGKVDRQTTTPFHLKLFYSTGGFQSLTTFPTTPTAPLPPHLQIYTWPTCTLRELSHLLTTALPSLLPTQIGTRLVYRLIYPDTRSYPHPAQNGSIPPPRYLSKDLGSVVVGGDGPGVLPATEEEKGYVAGGVMAGRLEGDPGRTLGDARFVIGDWVECAVFPPGADGSVAPAPASTAQAYRGARTGEFGARGEGGGREFAAREYRVGGDTFFGGRGGVLGGPRENGFGGFRVGRGGRGSGGFGGGGIRGGEGVPMGEWRRGERVPEGRGGFGGRGRGRGY